MKTKTFYFTVHSRYNGIESDTNEDIRTKLYDALKEEGFEFAVDSVEGECD